MYKPKQYHAVPKPAVVVKPVNVYFRDSNKKLACIAAADCTDHRDAILAVKESLVASREGWEMPVLAVVQGGKQ